MKGWKYFCGLFLAAILFVSCEKETTLTNYLFYFNEEEFTQPRDIADPDIRAFYLEIREDFAKLEANHSWQINIVNRNFRETDEQFKATADADLARIKELEARYRKEIGELGANEGSSFYIKYVYRLTRDIPADHATPDYSTAILQEYSFELRYGQD